MTFDPAPNAVDVVGEGSYQGNLEALAGGRNNNGARNPDQRAYLIPEPTNPYDPNAVRVIITPVQVGQGAIVGYLRRADSLAYRPIIDRLAAVGRLARCRASITGGWDNRRDGGTVGSFGVRLDMGKPDDLMRELEADPALLRPTWGA